MSTHARVGVIQRNGTVLSFNVHLDGNPDTLAPTLLALATQDDRPVGLRMIDEIVRYGDMRALDDKLIRCEVAQDPTPAKEFPSELEFKRVAVFNRHKDMTSNYFYIVYPNGEVQYRSRCDDSLNYWCRLKKGYTLHTQHTTGGTYVTSLPAIMEWDPGEEYYIGDGHPQGSGWKVWTHR